MEETQQIISKKRTRSSSSYNPLMGTLTRSKSKIYLHCNRSGRARSDSFRINKQNPVGTKNENKKPRRKNPSYVQDWSCFVIKDLRARRVFSLADNDRRLCVDDDERKESDQKKCSSDEKNVEQCKDVIESNMSTNLCEAEVNVRSNILNSEDCVQATPPDTEMLLHMGKTEDLQDKKVQNNSLPKSVSNPWSRVRVFKAPGSLSYRRLLPYLMDMVQENSCKGSPKKVKFSNVESQQEVSVDKQYFADDNSTDSASMQFGLQNDNSKRIDQNEEIKMRVSRKDKNFESSSPEFSSMVDNSQMNGYSDDTKPLDNGESKRVVSNSSCIAQDAKEQLIQMTPQDAKSKWGINSCSQLKLFKTRSSLNYRRMLPYLMDIAKDNSGDSRNGNCPKLEKNLQENLVSPSSSSSDHSDTPVEKLYNRSCHLKDDTDSCGLQMSLDHNIDITESADLQEKQESLVIMNILDTKDGNSDTGTGTCSSLVSPPLVSGDLLDLVSQEFTNAAKIVEGGKFSQNSYKLEACNGSAKSILKRHPRGCRGLCTCLNCASFRLHAEKAFEFSKNQMQDAEEVALDLIKELSHMRNMLEEAASGSNDNFIMCNNEVKKACRKASEAEELAKSRLSLMNYDVNIHCRISSGERPRVRFANNVEKRTFHV